MSRKVYQVEPIEQGMSIESRRISVGSDNVCSAPEFESDSESISDSHRSKVPCAACGRGFWPDKTRTKFCDHDCYSDWRSRRTSFVDRFWSKVNKTSNCWLWTGVTRGMGYGMVALRRVDGKQPREMAHRLSWQLANGPIPDGLLVLHRCDVPACVNPEHLFLGTTKDNAQDALRKGRLRPRGQMSPASLANLRHRSRSETHVANPATGRIHPVTPVLGESNP